MSASRLPLRTRVTTTALLAGLSLAAACGDTPTGTTGGNGGGTPAPSKPATVQIVQVAPDTLTLLAVGGHRRVEATAHTAGGAVLQGRTAGWTSSDPAVAYVDASGNVTGLQPGRAWITATIDGRTGQARVDVLPLTVDSIALAASAMHLESGTSRYLGATLYAADGRVLYDRRIDWSISDTTVATVNERGLVTGLAGGRAWVTATSEGRTARAEVIVPLVKTMTLATAGGAWLPAALLDTIYDDGGGRRRHVRVVAVGGTLALHTRSRVYRQDVTLHTHERRGSCTEWGSCIWDAELQPVAVRVVSDGGTVQRNPYTGLPIFYSDAVPGWVYHADAAPADGYTIWQALPGTGVRLAWGYRL